MNLLFKRNLNASDGNKLALLLTIILVLLCIGLKINNDKVVQTLESSYSRSLYELVEYLDNVETLLAKAQISTSSEYAAKNLTEIWRKADLAQSSLSQIPITHITLEKVEQFLNQLSDYSYSLSHKAIEGHYLTDEELKNLEDFYARCQMLNTTINTLSMDMANGSLSWSELTKEQDNSPLAQEVANLSQDSFSKVEENMQDYEGLIYDGPFSDHMESATPLGLGDEKYDKQMAEEVVYEYFDKNSIEEISYIGLIDSNIKVHRFEAIANLNSKQSKIYVDVTEQGGKVLWFLIVDYKSTNDVNANVDYESQYSNNNLFVDYESTSDLQLLSFDDAKEKAIEFLNNHKISNMKETYYTIENGVLTINFAYMQDDVVCYPDLLKVKVSLLDGSILGMEAQSYYSSHHKRTIPEAKVSIDEARAKINKNLEILSEGIAVIPTDFKTELTVYEFKGKVKDNEFIVYVNIETGEEEKIFMIINTPNGVLTI